LVRGSCPDCRIATRTLSLKRSQSAHLAGSGKNLRNL
jgi:hypothetical protein